MIKAYAVTGFLGSGKTTLLNAILKERLDAGHRPFFIQFEAGEAKLSADPGKRAALTALAVSKRNWDSRPETVAAGLRHRILAAEEKGKVSELWIEWNGAAPFAELLALFSRPAERSVERPPADSGRLYGVAELAGVITLVDTPRYDAFMAQAGNTLSGFLAAADAVVLRGDDQRRVSRQIKRLVPGTRLIPLTAESEFEGNSGGELNGSDQKAENSAVLPVARRAITALTGWQGAFKSRLRLLSPLLFLLVASLGYGFLAGTGSLFTVDRFLTIFLGIFLQGFPFLLLGVLISSAVQVFMSPGLITRLFPQGRLSSLLFALVSGFFLPVCDCASIPVFHSLLRKGVPVSAAVTFMVASPIINPVVVLSTYYAFGGDWLMVVARFVSGLMAGLITGLLLTVGQRKKGRRKDQSTGDILRPDRLLTRCSLRTGIVPGATTSTGDKVSLFGQHVVLELFDILRYFLLAAALSAGLQVAVSLRVMPTGADNLPISILIMMAAAFLLSLCSSSDAVIAKSFARSFPPAALLAFLIYGPVMDMKNLIMLSAGSRRSFIIRLFFTVTAVMFGLALLFHYISSWLVF